MEVYFYLNITCCLSDNTIAKKKKKRDFSNIIVTLISLIMFFLLAQTSEKESQVIQKLKVLVDKQRDEIRAKDHELTLRNGDVEAVRI